MERLNPRARSDHYGSRINRTQSPLRAGSVPYLSIMLGSLVPLLLIADVMPLLPPLGFLMLIAWRLMRPGLLPLWAGAPLGAFDDLVSGQPFGQRGAAVVARDDRDRADRGALPVARVLAGLVHGCAGRPALLVCSLAGIRRRPLARTVGGHAAAGLAVRAALSDTGAHGGQSGPIPARPGAEDRVKSSLSGGKRAKRPAKVLNASILRSSFERRAVLIGSVQGGIGVLLAARMGYLAIAENEKYRLESESNRVNLTLVPPRRGLDSRS